MRVPGRRLNLGFTAYCIQHQFFHCEFRRLARRPHLFGGHHHGVPCLFTSALRHYKRAGILTPAFRECCRYVFIDWCSIKDNARARCFLDAKREWSFPPDLWDNCICREPCADRIPAGGKWNLLQCANRPDGSDNVQCDRPRLYCCRRRWISQLRQPHGHLRHLVQCSV